MRCVTSGTEGGTERASVEPCPTCYVLGFALLSGLRSSIGRREEQLGGGSYYI
jgi:hypothetical protein